MAKDASDIWVVSELFYPDETSTGFIMSSIAQELAHHHRVSVISGPDSCQDNKSNTKFESWGGINIYRVSDWGLGKLSLVTRFLRLFIVSVGLLINVLRRVEPASKILLVTNPILFLFFVPLIKGFKKSEITLIIHDVYPDNLVAAKIFRANHIFVVVLGWVINYCYDQLDYIVVLGRDMQKVLSSKTTTPISIIENWAQLDLIFPQPKSFSPFIDRIHLNKIVFLFAGNIGRVQGISTLLKLVRAFKDDERIHFMFAGEGVLLSSIEKAMKHDDLRNLTLVGRFKRSEQNEILASCDIGIVSLSENMYGLGVPCKTYNLLAAGKPILYLGERGSEVDLLIKDYDVGWSKDSSDFRGILELVRKICRDFPHFRKIKSLNARNLALNTFSKERIMKKFVKHFSET